MKNITVKNILIVFLSNIGDVAVATPIIPALKDKYPSAKIWALVSPKASGVLSSSPDIDELILYDKHSGWLDKWRLAMRLRGEKIDLTVDLRNTLFPFLVGSPLRTKMIRWNEKRVSSMQRKHFRRLKFLGIDRFSSSSFRFVSDELRNNVKNILGEVGLGESSFVCLAPGARDSKKRWSPEKFGQLVQQIYERFGYKTILLGSPDEKDVLNEVKKVGGESAVVFQRQINFSEVMAIISWSKLFCGNDSGLIHIAHEMRVPVVGIFGPTNPLVSGYSDDRSRMIFPYVKDLKDLRGGLDGIGVKEVFEACSDLMDFGNRERRVYELTDIALPPKSKILISRIDRIGDVVLTTPVFETIKKIYPDSRLSVLVSPATQSVVRGNPYVDEVLVYDKKGKEKGWFGTWCYAKKISKEKFDVVINFHATNRVFWLGFLARIPIRIGHKRKAWRLLTHAVCECKREGQKHESEYNYDLLKVLGISFSHPMPPLHFPTWQEDEISLVAKYPELESVPYVVLSPSASCISKRWPPERFREVGEVLNKKFGFRIVVTGTEAEKDIARQVVSEGSSDMVNLSGCLTLGELGQLFKNSKILISNDSGPVHIAAALEVPVISLFGRSDPGLSPARWRPLGKKSVYIHKPISQGEETTDYTKPCERLLKIQPADVLEEVERLL